MTIVPSGGSNPRAFSLLKQYSRKVTFGFCCTAATCAIFPSWTDFGAERDGAEPPLAGASVALISSFIIHPSAFQYTGQRLAPEKTSTSTNKAYDLTKHLHPRPPYLTSYIVPPA